MLGNYLQQTTSADDIFRYIFLGVLRVKSVSDAQILAVFLEVSELKIAMFLVVSEQKSNFSRCFRCTDGNISESF